MHTHTIRDLVRLRVHVMHRNPQSLSGIWGEVHRYWQYSKWTNDLYVLQTTVH